MDGLVDPTSPSKAGGELHWARERGGENGRCPPPLTLRLLPESRRPTPPPQVDKLSAADIEKAPNQTVSVTGIHSHPSKKVLETMQVQKRACFTKSYLSISWCRP